MAKTAKKLATKKKATPAKKSARPAAKKPVNKPVAKPAKKAPAGKPKPAAAKKAAKPAAGKHKGNTKPAKPVGKPVPAKKQAVASKPAAKPVALKTQAPVKAVSAPVKPAPEVKKAVAAQPVKPAAPPVAPKKPAAPVPPPAADNDVVHILKKGPPPPEIKAQFAALKKKKLPPGEKRVVKTEIINPHVIKDMPLAAAEKTTKKAEPKGKFTLEFILHAPVTLLYDFLTTPNGLAEWFAEEVDLRNDTYKFNWDGAIQYARIMSAKLDNHLRLRWMDKADGTYLEFRIQPDELTNEIALIITDFAESEDDMRTSRQLWEAQIQRLMKALGTY